MRRKWGALAALLVCASAYAQLNPTDPDWREVDAPPPPSVRTTGLIPLDMPRGTSLRFGVDPASVTVGKDGVVRYVVVATSDSGAINAMYEGLRCDKAEYRTYARHTADRGWAKTEAEWRTLYDGGAASRYNLSVARSGACMGRAPNISAQQIVRDLTAGANDKFRAEIR